MRTPGKVYSLSVQVAVSKSPSCYPYPQDRSVAQKTKVHRERPNKGHLHCALLCHDTSGDFPSPISRPLIPRPNAYTQCVFIQEANDIFGLI